jgi:D-alanyl-D-alanine carboxypeptidase/D-alanyl-D-alanine-endopeptidase (penicillin-binding protein 4)
MLQASDNQIAELLVRELDRHAGGAGTTAGGLVQVRDALTHLGVPLAGVSMLDGSGLSHADRSTCRALLATLTLGDDRPLAAVEAGLPVAGVSGSLVHLFAGTPLAGRLAAKGGYIDGVAALVGRIDGSHGRRFALVANGPFPFITGLALEEHVAEAVASA